MRISDWSSDVCSSDLREQPQIRPPRRADAAARGRMDAGGRMDRRRRSLRATARRSTAAAEGAVEGDSRPLPPHHPCAPRREQVRIAAAFAPFLLLGEADHAALPDQTMPPPPTPPPPPLG